ncbi:hypothetical protein QBC42DRAFT_284268 [Cladorrhinum samala]|uniref:Uncharacterized protein n=1 Tax=Cladorrhinum samala TaxID=585594 RepID=A0AAV9HXE6_9PEZI|nr:hypothetical protein QBC42DRAFT_284268 [Cladorrhinum samala]
MASAPTTPSGSDLLFYTIAEAKEKQAYWEDVAKANYEAIQAVAKYSGLGGEHVEDGPQECPVGWEVKLYNKRDLSDEDLIDIAQTIHREIEDVCDKLSRKEVIGLLAGAAGDNDGANELVGPPRAEYEFYSALYDKLMGIKDVTRQAMRDVVGPLIEEAVNYEPPSSDGADSGEVLGADWKKFKFYSWLWVNIIRLDGRADAAMLNKINHKRWTLYQRIKVRNMEKADELASKLYVYRIYREGKAGKHDPADPHPKSWSLRFKDEWDPKMREKGIKAPWW